MNDYNRGALPDPCLRLDYGFGEQWASVELGDGTGYVRLADYEKLESENAKLREECDHHKALWEHAHVTDCELRRIRSAWKNDRDENAKLRELVHKYGEYTSQDRCEGCVVKSRCNDGEIEECWQLTEILGLASELGIEVEE